MDTQERKSIAETILSQLGGKRFVVMTGAKDFAFGANGQLIFRLARGAKNGINSVTVELTPSDTYKMTFKKALSPQTVYKKIMSGVSVQSCEPVIVAEVEDVYCDQLQEVFMTHTGLYTSL